MACIAHGTCKYPHHEQTPDRHFPHFIEETYKGPIMSSMVGQQKKTFIVIFEYFVKKYGKAMPIDIKNNRAEMKKAVGHLHSTRRFHKADTRCGRIQQIS